MPGCIECDEYINQYVFDYSVSNFGVPLCILHQNWVREISKNTTEENLRLYFALRERGVPAQIEKFDGYKTIDIVIADARVNIEVDGFQHSFDPQQALADLKRTYYSFLDGYLTLRIPNSLVRQNLNETADYITDFLNVSRIRKQNGEM